MQYSNLVTILTNLNLPSAFGFRKKIYVILVHNDVCSESLMYCANEHHRFSELVENLPLRGSIKVRKYHFHTCHPKINLFQVKKTNIFRAFDMSFCLTLH